MENISVKELSMIEKFKAKAREFSMAYSTLTNIDLSGLTPDQKNEYEGLISTGENIRGTISWITESVDTVTGFFSDLFTFDGSPAVKNYINAPHHTTLGFLPLIPIAAVSASLAVMAKFITDVYLFERQMTEQKNLVASGSSPQAAADIVKKIRGTSFLETTGTIIKPIALAAGLWAAFKIYQTYKKA